MIDLVVDIACQHCGEPVCDCGAWDRRLTDAAVRLAAAGVDGFAVEAAQNADPEAAHALGRCDGLECPCCGMLATAWGTRAATGPELVAFIHPEMPERIREARFYPWAADERATRARRRREDREGGFGGFV